MKQLHHLVNIIPVIAKADTLTASELKALKLKVTFETTFRSLAPANVQSLSFWQIMSEIMENSIHIYTGEVDEDDNSEIGDLRVSHLVFMWEASLRCYGGLPLFL